MAALRLRMHSMTVLVMVIPMVKWLCVPHYCRGPYPDNTLA